MRISDWSSDVCSSDLHLQEIGGAGIARGPEVGDRLRLLLRIADAARDNRAAETERSGVEHTAARCEMVGKALVPHVASAKASGEKRELQPPDNRKSVVKVKRVSERVKNGGHSILKQNIETIKIN